MNKLCSKGTYIFVSLFFLFIISCTTNKTEQESIKNSSIQENIHHEYVKTIDEIKKHLEQLQHAPTISEKQNAYIKARTAFKKVEPILAYRDPENYKTLNAPNILKVEEEDLTNIKVDEAMSFQALEEELYAENITEQRINDITLFLISRLNFMQKNANFKHFSKNDFIWLMKNAVIRAGVIGTTGFDSPMLGQSLQETAITYQTLQLLLNDAENLFNNKSLFSSLIDEFRETENLLTNSNFDTFDRYRFLKENVHQQLQLLNKVAEGWGVKQQLELAINKNATSLFKNNTFNINHFADRNKEHLNPQTIALGKKLFNDKNLSKAKTMSCATCHQQELAFTDGLKTSLKQKRNSPTMTYAGLQHGMFADKRAGSLEGQIVSVVDSDTEFHTDLQTLVAAVKNNSDYATDFETVFKGDVTDSNIRFAIAEYIRSLAPFNSKFDRNINGEENTLTESEIRGFNLFMGKAACGTCHFAPTFNGTIPPNFTETEMELLGVPSKAIWQNATIDDDLGRYNVFHTEERKYFFKTPTLRNIAKTAPYMHNGVYETLEDVVKFYNVGGGAGIGIDLEYQTLPADPLNLTEQEIADLVAFMKTLTDKEFEEN